MPNAIDSVLNISMSPFSVVSFRFIRAVCWCATALLFATANVVDSRADNPPPPDNHPILTLTPDHADGVYALNEPAVWTVDVKSGDRSGLAAVPYAVNRDGGDTVATGTIDLSSAPATITATRAEPGALLVVVSVPTGGKRPWPWTGGAVFAPEKIGPAVPAPADFDESEAAGPQRRPA
jgi:hypothetical protein